MAGYGKPDDNECLIFRKLMSAYIDEETGEAETRSLSDHVAECSACKRELANFYVMRDMIKGCYAPKGEVDFSSDIMRRISFSGEGRVSRKKGYADRIFKYGVVAALLFAALGSTVLYSQSQTRKMMAEQRKFDTYAVEHAEQYAGEVNSAAASVISVNFER